MRQNPLTSLKNLTFESNWPYTSCSNSTLANGKTISVKKVQPLQKAKLALGINVYSPYGLPTKNMPVLSHHFVPNTYRDEKYDKLSIIQSMGEQEGIDTPLNPKNRSNYRRVSGCQTPLSKFASPAHSNLRRIKQESMTPVATRAKKRRSITDEQVPISEFEKMVKKNSIFKETLPNIEEKS